MTACGCYILPSDFFFGFVPVNYSVLQINVSESQEGLVMKFSLVYYFSIVAQNYKNPHRIAKSVQLDMKHPNQSANVNKTCDWVKMNQL